MLKRLIITAALAGSTLVVGGAANAQAASAAPKCATPMSQHVTTAGSANRCRWRSWNGRRCWFCWHNGAWELQWCRGGGGGGSGGWSHGNGHWGHWGHGGSGGGSGGWGGGNWNH
ncbi:hypothetical protein ACIBG4_01150 [Nonomuraea sp. NPDC050383]|uniref:hypothetical protein n=1 Tax=Nonomuraea sp. NPDC050383 TaxID=3364362 RepID=UPI00378F66CB